jgi:hypothetical protein
MERDFTVTPTETFLPPLSTLLHSGATVPEIFPQFPRKQTTNQHISQKTNVPFFDYNVKTNYSSNCIFYRWPAKHTLQANSQIPYYLLRKEG